MSTYQIASLIIGLIGASGAIFALLAWRSLQKSVEIVRDSLKLSREQASLKPDLYASHTVGRAASGPEPLQESKENGIRSVRLLFG
jgi:hypothetical protein